MPSMQQIEQARFPVTRKVDLRPGDKVRVHVRIVEQEPQQAGKGGKAAKASKSRGRIQVFEGTVIAIKKGGHRTTFTVRKVSYGIGVERIFPLESPMIEKIEVTKRHRVRRAKLYYLRQLRGKAARLKEIRNST